MKRARTKPSCVGLLGRWAAWPTALIRAAAFTKVSWNRHEGVIRASEDAYMNFSAVIRKPDEAPTSAHALRQAQILTRLHASGFQSIADLSAAFDVSAQTMRRDVNALALQGLCRRSHGGIWPMAVPQDAQNAAYAERREMGRAAKHRIARVVAEHVPDHASVFLGVGTTLECCAEALAGKSGLRVMTNNLNAVLALARHANAEISIPGGRVRNLDLDIVSAEAHGFFDRYTVDIGIFGVGAISAEGLLLDFQEDEAHMRRALSSNCRKRFLAFDHSKFDRRATVRYGHITEVDAVFTDAPPPAHIADMLDAAGVQVFMPPL